MARFYADIQGNRGEATRMGTTASGMSGHVRGWNIGARVVMDVAQNGEDRVTVYLTSGSSGYHEELLARHTEGEEEDTND
jgi:archaellum component FlaG (FlaF/FlaG flagellin family)